MEIKILINLPWSTVSLIKKELMHLGGTRGSFLLYIISLLHDNTSCYIIMCQVLPVGREMFSCSLAFKELACSYACKSAVTLIFSQIQTSNKDVQEKDKSDTNCDSSNVDSWGCFSSLLKCWKKLAKYIGSNPPTDFLLEAVYSLTLGSMAQSQYGEK
jgi:hypothetical protein